MKRLPIWEIMDRMQAYGRTFYDEQDDVLYSNYTCGAFEVDFTGTLLAASFCAIPDTSAVPGAPLFPTRIPSRAKIGLGFPFFWTGRTCDPYHLCTRPRGHRPVFQRKGGNASHQNRKADGKFQDGSGDIRFHGGRDPEYLSERIA